MTMFVWLSLVSTRATEKSLAPREPQKNSNMRKKNNSKHRENDRSCGVAEKILLRVVHLKRVEKLRREARYI